MNRIFNYLKYTLNKISKPEIIGGYIDPNGKVNKKTRISSHSHLSNRQNLYIDDNVFIGHFNIIDGYKKIFIEEGVQITNYVSVLTHSSHNSIRLHGKNYIEDLKYLFGLESGDVYIGKYSFIGSHSIIMPGTKIGKGCIVGAFSYVQGEFADYSILRGQPAKIVGNTKERDYKYLKDNPELENKYYNK
ncbi:MAG: acyltransferase [Salinivirgaceae bacterium]|nr:acyltransferase [Salinivirgaceae bacterium]